MATLTRYTSFELPVSGEPPILGGRKGDPTTLTVTGNEDRWRGSINNNTTVTLWDAAASPISSFNFCWIKSDTALLIEFQGAAAANNSTSKAAANHPEIRTTGTIMTYAAGGSFGGSETAIAKVLARNTSGGTAAVNAIFIL